MSPSVCPRPPNLGPLGATEFREKFCWFSQLTVLSLILTILTKESLLLGKNGLLPICLQLNQKKALGRIVKVQARFKKMTCISRRPVLTGD